MAKKQRTAKQKAATRKLVALNKRRSKPKRRRSSPKRRTNSTKRRKPANSKKSSRMRRRFSKDNLKNGFKGFLGGGGAGELAEDAVSFGTDNLLVNKVVRAGASAAGGYWVGGKSATGAIGGLSNGALDIGLSVMRGGTTSAPGRFGRL